jgi:hypothetical protein
VEIDHAELEYPRKACGRRNRVLPHGVEQKKYQTDVEVDEALLAPSHFSSGVPVPGEE